MSPYLMCYKDCHNCSFNKDCYERVIFDSDSDAISEIPILEAKRLYSEDEDE